MVRLKMLLLVIFCCSGFAFADSIAFSPSQLPDSTSKVREVMISLYGIDPVENPEDVDILDESEIMTAVNIAAMRDVPIAMSDSSSIEKYEDIVSKMKDIIKSYQQVEIVKENIDKSGGRIVVHEVQRGESWESIAELYDVDEDDLRAINPFLVCATGMTLDVPVKMSALALDDRKKESGNSAYAEAKSFLDNGKYKKAIKAYDKIIQGGNASVRAYFNRGKAWFLRGKMRQAMADFDFVINNDSEGVYSDASTYYENAADIQRKRDESRNNLWASIGDAFAKTAYDMCEG